MVPSSRSLSNKGRQEQLRYLLQHASKTNKRGLSLGHTISFKRQADRTSGFVNSLARILKLWVSFLHSPGDPDFKKGCSFRMELIAVEAANGSSDDMRKGLERALILICNFRDIYVTNSRFFGEESIPQHLLRQRPLLICPLDPHENLLDEKVCMCVCTQTHGQKHRRTHRHRHTDTQTRTDTQTSMFTSRRERELE